ncbi:hypothetical protein ACFL27_28750 [candidate division CSSED10-310 bacterium]|uniref:ISXO2-like transposase domain-containing protein n=1 Tax=candidate division CSSED10-310 bacterium TaxID=2855610 RepID=A0ABV6Z6X0_UNCC1
MIEDQVVGQKNQRKTSAIKHGQKNTRLYSVWISIKTRCHNPKVNAYKYNGALGIKMCERWQKNFLNFKADMGESYQEHVAQHGVKNTTLLRIDKEKDYQPSNCRWATKAEQAFNTRKKKRQFMAIRVSDCSLETSSNITEFAQKHGLSRCCISTALHGHTKDNRYRDWIFLFVDDRSG